MSIARKILMSSGGKKDSTYVDDVFSTYLYRGTGATQTITNGIDLSGEGGMVWIKNRTLGDSYNFNLYDTERGATKFLVSNNEDSEDTSATRLNQFNNNGFRLGGNTVVNASTKNFLSWSFRKAPGFFDIVTYTGNGVAGTQIAHNLGSVPGMVIIKKTSSNGFWPVGHRSLDWTAGDYLRLNTNNAVAQHIVMWNDTAPTSTHVTLGTSSTLNTNGQQYVMYLFAGGESTAATARSVDFDGSSDYLSIADNSDFALGSGDFTFEAWIKYDALNNSGTGWLADWNNGALGWFFGTTTTGGVSNRFIFGWSDTGSNINTIDSGHTVKADGQFHHYSVTRSGTTLYFFVDGNLIKTNAGVTESFYNPSGAIAIGQNPDVGGSAWLLNGKISNLRLIKGTCLYTSAFRPPTEPLTNVTNTILLCCNNSSVIGSTVTPATITAVGSPTASTYSPFDDPEGFQFGEEGDQSIIKCGTYVGNGNNSGQVIEGPMVNVGWEPSWVLVKMSTSGDKWNVFSSMTPNPDGFINFVCPNETDWEGTSNYLKFNSTGFQPKISHDQVNANGQTYIWMAIRRPDGYVGKPAEVGTDTFAMDVGVANQNPNFDSGFPVGFALLKNPTGGNWNATSRLTGTKYLITNQNGNEANYADYTYDYNDGYIQGSLLASAYQSWMWKRGAGFDVVNYIGNNSPHNDISHNLGRTPEMIWIKARDRSAVWVVYHKGLNGGTNPNTYNLQLNGAGAEGAWNWSDSTPPTSTHFTVSSGASINFQENYLAMLFASVDGISKVGSYTGSSSALTITTGFSPRYVIIKNRTNTGNNWTTGWFTFDTTRGWAAGNNDKRMRLNDTAAQSTEDWTDPTSTGFTINANSGNQLNNNGEGYIYYAHA